MKAITGRGRSRRMKADLLMTNTKLIMQVSYQKPYKSTLHDTVMQNGVPQALWPSATRTVYRSLSR